MSRGTRSGLGDVKVLEGVLDEGLSSPSDAEGSGGDCLGRERQGQFRLQPLGGAHAL